MDSQRRCYHSENHSSEVTVEDCEGGYSSKGVCPLLFCSTRVRIARLRGEVYRYSLEMYGLSIQVHNVNVLSEEFAALSAAGLLWFILANSGGFLYR